MSGEIDISGRLSGINGQFAETIGPFTTTLAAPVGQILTPALAAGDNVFTVPPGTTTIIVDLPEDNTVQVYLKRGTADPGFELALTGSFKIDINPLLMTSFNLNAAAAISSASVVACE